MKMKHFYWILFTATFLFSTPAFAEAYKVTVTRIDNNVYKDDYSNIIIITSLCLELALMDDAILIVDGTYDSKLIFRNGDKCDVKQIISR